jgi:hypothetical protein
MVRGDQEHPFPLSQLRRSKWHVLLKHTHKISTSSQFQRAIAPPGRNWHHKEQLYALPADISSPSLNHSYQVPVYPLSLASQYMSGHRNHRGPTCQLRSVQISSINPQHQPVLSYPGLFTKSKANQAVQHRAGRIAFRPANYTLILQATCDTVHPQRPICKNWLINL